MTARWPADIRKPVNRADALSLLVESPAYADRIRQRFERQVIRSEDDGACWGWSGSRVKAGYPRVSMFKGVEARGNRVSFVLANGRLPNKEVVAHSCDNPECCNPDHLFEATHSENILDAVSKNRHVPYRATANRKTRRISDADAAYIKGVYQRCSRSLGQTALARRFGVTQAAVRLLIEGKTYREVEALPVGPLTG